MVYYGFFKPTYGKEFEETARLALEIFKDNPDSFRTTDLPKYIDFNPIVALNRFWAKGFVMKNETRSPFNVWSPRAKYYLQYMSSEQKEVCSICHRSLPLREFHLIMAKGKKPQRMTMCEECRAEHDIKV